MCYINSHLAHRYHSCLVSQSSRGRAPHSLIFFFRFDMHFKINKIIKLMYPAEVQQYLHRQQPLEPSGRLVAQDGLVRPHPP